MNTAITHQPSDEAIEIALVEGDLSRLTSPQRRQYYLRVCDSVGLNPLTKPFEYLRLNGKLILYAGKNCADQLRATRGVSIDELLPVVANGICTVTARATMDGRKDTDVGAVSVEGLKGEALSNAVMKAHTKAKRRVTLSICGLSMLDDSEVDEVRGAERIEEPPRPQLAPKPASTPPPALHEGGNSSALWSHLSAEISQAADLQALTVLKKAVKQALDQGKITLTQRAQLSELLNGRHKALKAGKSVEEILAGNDLPAAWGGPPDVDAVEETCLVCDRALGSEPAVQCEDADGVVRFRHKECTL